jgi:hypothetical protein
MALQLKRVVVKPGTRPGERRADRFELLLKPGPAALQDAHPGVGVGAPEEREADAEVLVFPG